MRKIVQMLLLFVFTAGIALAQERVVSGKVSDEAGEALIGATVVVKGTSDGTVTDVDGNYKVSVQDGATLVFSYVGYVKQEINVGSRTTINLSMELDATRLNEIVVTALGIEKEERKLGYSVQSVGGDEIQKSATNNVLNSLAGKVAGVQIAQGSGVAGQTVRITIRGNNSLVQGKNQPLMIVDGVPIENSITGAGSGSLVSSDNGKDWGSGVNNLNTWDIEDVTVLKGPNAAALYGSRGANGVILITTKKGKSGEGLGIDFSMASTTDQPYRYRDVQNTYGEGSSWVTPYDWDAPANIHADGSYKLPNVGYWGSGVSWGPEMDGRDVTWWNGETLPFSPQPDNIKSFFHNGNQTSYNLAFSGGNDAGNFRASMTRLDVDAMTPNTKRSQNTVNLNANINVSDRVRATASVNYMNSYTLNSPHLGNSESSIGKNLTYNWGRSYRPDIEANNYQFADGTRQPAGVGYPRNDTFGRGRGRAGSFFWALWNNNTERNRDRLISSIGLNVDLTDWLSLDGRLGLDSYTDDYEGRNKPQDIDGTIGGRYSHNVATNKIMNHTAFLRIKEQSIGSDLKVSAYVGGEYYNRTYYSIQTDNGGRNFVYPNLYYARNILYPTTISTGRANGLVSGEGRYEREIQSAFGAVDLSYRDYLFVQVTGRNDWSSTLPDGANSYFYPSVSLGFDITQAFNMNDDRLSFAKLRMAIAQVGNDTDPYQTGARLGSGIYAGQPVASVSSTIPPLALKPERQNSSEIGLDLRFLDDRARLDLTWYNIRSFDQILNSPVPLTSGYSTLRFNTGELKNQGIEMLIGYKVIENENLVWDAGINFSRNRNTVVSLTEGATQLNLGSNLFGNNGPGIVARPGEQFGTIIGWDFEYYDTNGDGETNASEKTPENRLIDNDGKWYDNTSARVPMGNSTPDWLAGLRNTLTYKGFTLNTLIDFKIGGDVFWGSHATAMGYGQSPETLAYRNAESGGLSWSDANGTYDNGVIKPGVYADGTPNTTVVSSGYMYRDVFSWGPGITTPFVMDNSYVKLRELSVSYDFTPEMLSKVKFIKRASITLVGRNLFYIADNTPDNLDPEGIAGSGYNQGIEWGQLPGTRSYGFTLNTGF